MEDSISHPISWDCPELVELNKWTELLKSEGVAALGDTRKPLEKLLQSIANIRHTAVHRLRTNSVRLEQFLIDAEDLVGALGNPVYANVTSQLDSARGGVTARRILSCLQELQRLWNQV